MKDQKTKALHMMRTACGLSCAPDKRVDRGAVGPMKRPNCGAIYVAGSCLGCGAEEAGPDGHWVCLGEGEGV